MGWFNTSLESSRKARQSEYIYPNSQFLLTKLLSLFIEQNSSDPGEQSNSYNEVICISPIDLSIEGQFLMLLLCL